VKYPTGGTKEQGPYSEDFRRRRRRISPPAVSVYRNRVDLTTLTRILEITAAGGTSVAHLKELSKGLEYWSLEDPAALSARAQHKCQLRTSEETGV
jgi:hypothetical protein